MITFLKYVVSTIVFSPVNKVCFMWKPSKFTMYENITRIKDIEK
jgi:hypothetical protein